MRTPNKEKHYRIFPDPVGRFSRQEIESKLQEVEWRYKRPGVFKRRIDHQGITYTDRYFCCQLCGFSKIPTYMLRNELWDVIAPDDGIMCFECAEYKLGRPITVDDLRFIPVNKDLIYILATRMR